MTVINAYLTFNGNCREAMTFYKECLGGALDIQTVGESPVADKMPEQMKSRVLHAALTRGDLVLLGSDMCGDNGLKRGNAVSLVLNCESEQEIRAAYEKLSAGGEPTHPIEPTFWGALFGELTDKFGNQWMLNYYQSK